MNPMLDPLTSPSLLSRLRREETRDEAWKEFVARYGRLLFYWCEQRGLKRSDAEDVAQETLLILLRVIKDFRYTPGRSFRGWMRTVAHTAWYQMFERSQRSVESQTEGLEQLGTLEARDDLIERFESMARAELLERAVELVRQRVDERTWQAFALTCLEHRDCVEVAASLGLKTNNVYVARSRIKAMLRQTIARLDQEP